MKLNNSKRIYYHHHFFTDASNLGSYDFNDEASSMVVVSGYWKKYEHAGYNPSGGYATEWGPGIIVANLHDKNGGDKISSIKKTR